APRVVCEYAVSGRGAHSRVDAVKIVRKDPHVLEYQARDFRVRDARHPEVSHRAVAILDVLQINVGRLRDAVKPPRGPAEAKAAEVDRDVTGRDADAALPSDRKVAGEIVRTRLRDDERRRRIPRRVRAVDG